MWQKIFSSSVAPQREAVQGYCCVQFVVRKDAIRLRTRQFYRDGLDYFGSYESYTNMLPLHVAQAVDAYEAEKVAE